MTTSDPTPLRVLCDNCGEWMAEGFCAETGRPMGFWCHHCNPVPVDSLDPDDE